MTVAFSLILSGYCLMLLVLLLGWVRMRNRKVHGLGKVKSGISVVVACRNEEENIESLVRSLSSLHYPADQHEVILVDDHSSDKTYGLMKALTGILSNFVLVQLEEGVEGKKQALNAGLSRSKFNLIATTDADCTVPSDWLAFLSLFFERDETKMLVGAVRLSRDKTFFSRIQAMEFTSLIGSAAAAIGLGHPVMSNGASLAFRKEVFKEVDGYEGNLPIPSGDDEFLMRKIFNRYPNGIVFINYPESTVTSLPQRTIRDFFFQRLRWAGKWKYNSDLLTRVLAVFIMISQIAFGGLIVNNILHPDATMTLIAVKILLELVFLVLAGGFVGLRFGWLPFLTLQIIYPLYVTGIGLLSWVGSYQWKQRNYK